jgi:hypothetical protein
MTAINKLSTTDTLTDGDLAPLWITAQGDTRKASLSLLAQYILAVLAEDGLTLEAPLTFTAGLVLRQELAADIADIGELVNTSGKVAGMAIWDTTNKRIMVAAGSTPGSAWWIADGSASVTPA